MKEKTKMVLVVIGAILVIFVMKWHDTSRALKAMRPDCNHQEASSFEYVDYGLTSYSSDWGGQDIDYQLVHTFKCKGCGRKKKIYGGLGPNSPFWEIYRAKK